MASLNYILVQPNGYRVAGQAREFIDALQAVLDKGNKLKNTLSQINGDGDVAKEADSGWTPDDFATVYGLINSAMTDINNSGFIAQLLSRCG